MINKLLGIYCKLRQILIFQKDKKLTILCKIINHHKIHPLIMIMIMISYGHQCIIATR